MSQRTVRSTSGAADAKAFTPTMGTASPSAMVALLFISTGFPAAWAAENEGQFSDSTAC